MSVLSQKSGEKPLLRGHIHQAAFFAALGACALLIAKSTDHSATISSIVYSCGLIVLFGTSALYHRPYWPPSTRALLKRFDHAAIFILIAGSFTPVCMLALPDDEGFGLLVAIWIAAAVGILQSLFWPKAPRWLTTLFYVVVGWFAAPYLRLLQISLGWSNLILLAAGGVVYTLGAVLYALRLPQLTPRVFGYHEFFHVLTVIGAVLHFIVIYQLIR